MWALIPKKTQILLIAAGAILGAWALEAIYGYFTENSVSWFRLISPIAFILGTIVVVAANALWRPLWRALPIVARATFPDLNGQWKGTLISSWEPKPGEALPPIPVEFWIRQTLFTFAVKIKTAESTSYSTRCLLEAESKAGLFRVWYSYSNQPLASLASRSVRHEGVAWLQLDLDRGTENLTGMYYTERKTRGDIDISRCVSGAADKLEHRRLLERRHRLPFCEDTYTPQKARRSPRADTVVRP